MNKKTNIIGLIFLILCAALMLFPFLWSISASLQGPGEAYQMPPKFFQAPFHFENYAKVWTEGNMAQYSINSVFLTLMCIIGTVISDAIAGYALARYNSKLITVVFVLMIGTMYIPGNILAIPQYVMWQKMKMLDTYIPIIVPKFFGDAAGIFLMRQCFKAMPGQFYEAASIDGLHPLKIFSKIYLPLAKPMLIVVIIKAFMSEWNDVFGPLIYITDKSKYTLTIGLLYLRGEYLQNMELLIAASVISIIPLVIVYLCAQKYFISGMISSGIKG